MRYSIEAKYFDGKNCHREYATLDMLIADLTRMSLQNKKVDTLMDIRHVVSFSTIIITTEGI